MTIYMSVAFPILAENGNPAPSPEHRKSFVVMAPTSSQALQKMASSLKDEWGSQMVGMEIETFQSGASEDGSNGVVVLLK